MSYRNRPALMMVLFAPVLMLALGQPARSQEPAAKKDAAAEKDEDVRSFTRVYDVRDLVFVLDKSDPSTIVPPTRLGQRPPPNPTPSTQPSDAPAPRQNTPESLAEEIVDLVRETVDPESWRDNGGTVGAIRTLSGVLIITQSPENHRQIVNLFVQLRETRARHITVQARWVALSPANLKAVAKPLKSDPTLYGVDMAALDRLGENTLQWYGQMTFFNAMTVRINSGRARTVVTDQTPVLGTAGTMAYQPAASLVQAGLLLDITAVLNPEGTKVVLNIQSVASDWENPPGASNGPTTRPYVWGITTQPPAEIDRMEMVVQQMRTSVALPTDQPVIIGGMTLDPGDRAGRSGDPKQLYLVIEANGTKGE